MSEEIASAAAGFLESALTEDSSSGSAADVLDWLESMRAQQHLVSTPIPFRELGEWSFEDGSGDLIHKSGKFFRISGIRVESAFADQPEWDQPIIGQPEIGILGILSREIGGVVHLLMQAKMEPGNPLGIQLAPTVQATHSNYTQVHNGARPPYLEYFLHRDRSRVLIDQLQWEQGSAFLRKRNRNIVVAADEEVPVGERFRWLTVGQVKRLLAYPNLVSMDARSVLACMPLVDPGTGLSHKIPRHVNEFAAGVLGSYASLDATRDDQDVQQWLADLKRRNPLKVRNIGLSQIKGWRQSERDVRHIDDRFFSVIAVKVESDSREVARWAQPIIASVATGLIALLITRIDGALHALVKARAEPGSADSVTVGPTIQRALDFHSGAKDVDHSPFFDLLANASERDVRYSCVQSEEGGRFFRVENLYRIVEIEEADHLSIPPGYIWLTFRQMQDLVRRGLLSVEARTLLSCISLT